MNRPAVFRTAACVAMLLVAGVARPGVEAQAFGYEQWERAVRERGLDPREVVFPFRANEEMAAWAREVTRPVASAAPEVKLVTLQNAFFDRGEFSFSYDDQRTLTAEEAFAEGHGNCMSFTSMFIALSRSLGIPTFLLEVERLPGVERQENLVVVNRHVVAGYRTPTKIYYYDFFVTTSTTFVSHQIIDDVGASAIYHTNHGGLAIRADDLDGALHHLGLAVDLAPDWVPAWVDLGVALSRNGDIDAALDAFQRALAIEPENSSALINMAKIFGDLGRDEEAQTALRAAAEGTRNPFTLIAMADVEMVRGNLDEARKYVKRARWWYPKEPAVYDALSRISRLEGDQEKALKYSRKASDLRQRAVEDDGQDDPID
ncbi:MAG: tetratricopeptide repeat protein [Acidobacteriota bacterium]